MEEKILERLVRSMLITPVKLHLLTEQMNRLHPDSRVAQTVNGQTDQYRASPDFRQSLEMALAYVTRGGEWREFLQGLDPNTPEE